MPTLITQAKTLTGSVVSTKMAKTVVVVVERYEKHPRYGKFIRSRKKFKVHDPKGKATMGDRVTIVACRPLSKDKHFRLLEVTSHQSQVTSDETGNGSQGTGNSNV